MKRFLRILILWLFGFLTPLLGQQSLLQVQDVRFTGKLPLKVSLLKKTVGLKQGAPVTKSEIEKRQKALLIFLNRKGYLWARIDSMRLLPLQDSTKFDLEFGIHIGPLFTVDSIMLVSDSIPAAQYRKRIHLQTDAPFDQDVLTRDIQALTDFAAEQGYPFAVVQTKPFVKNKTHRVRLEIRIHEGPKVFVKGVLLQGNRYTRASVALRSLYFEPNMPFRQSWFRKIVPRLRKLQIFKSVSEPQMLRTAADSVIIIIPVEEGNATTFDGVVGYVPQPGNAKPGAKKGYFTGLLNFSFQNLFGTGRKLKIFWEKSDRLSEHFNFGYLEPWVFNQPVDLGFNFAREVKDTLYIAYDFGLNGNVHLNENFSFFLNFNRHSVTPDSLAKITLGMRKNRIYNLETGIRYDTRDYPLNPQKGLFYQSSYRFGLKENLGSLVTAAGDTLPKNLNLNTWSLTFEFYQKIFKNQVAALKLNARKIRGSHLQLSDYFWFGGSRSVRGYREKQFSGYLVSWANLEYRFITGQNARIFLFTDLGYYENKIPGQAAKKFLQGMGLGLRFDTPLGIMGLDFGLAKGEGFNQAKIHFGVTNRF